MKKKIYFSPVIEVTSIHACRIMDTSNKVLPVQPAPRGDIIP